MKKYYCPNCKKFKSRLQLDTRLIKSTSYRRLHLLEVNNNGYDKFLVTRPNDTVLVYLMRNKNDNTYSYVNVTKGHICPCKFPSIIDAVKDMDRLKIEGKIIRYEITN